jgi:hypothetical protein
MEDQLLPTFPTKEEATKLAEKYAQKHGYKIKFFEAHHESPTVPLPAYIFYVVTKPPRSKKDIRSTGLPLCVVVDETTGYTDETRTI